MRGLQHRRAVGIIEAWPDESLRNFGSNLQGDCRLEVRVGSAIGLPATWGTYLHGTKGFRFRGFRFVMAFIVREENIFVVALAHTRRRPGYWKKRIR